MLQLNRFSALAVLLLLSLGSSLGAQNASATTGPGGTSGGNSHNGRIVDVQRVPDITRHAVYLKVMKPAIARLKATVPRFGQEFEDNAKSLDWYLISSPNQPVKPEVNCIPMQTDQAGRVENNQEVWINPRAVKGVQELGELMVHEVAVRMGASEYNDCERHQYARKFVFQLLTNAPEEKIGQAVQALMGPSLYRFYPTVTQIKKIEARYATHQKLYVDALTGACAKAAKDVEERGWTKDPSNGDTAKDPVEARERDISVSGIIYYLELTDAYSKAYAYASVWSQDELPYHFGNLSSEFSRDVSFFRARFNEWHALRKELLTNKARTASDTEAFLNALLKTCEAIQKDPSSQLPKD